MLQFSRKKNPRVNIHIKDKRVDMTIDTGASINVIDQENFRRLGAIKLQKANIRAYTYGSKEPVQFLGKFTTMLESKNAYITDEIYVVKNNRSGCLLSFDAAKNNKGGL